MDLLFEMEAGLQALVPVLLTFCLALLFLTDTGLGRGSSTLSTGLFAGNFAATFFSTCVASHTFGHGVARGSMFLIAGPIVGEVTGIQTNDEGYLLLCMLAIKCVIDCFYLWHLMLGYAMRWRMAIILLFSGVDAMPITFFLGCVMPFIEEMVHSPVLQMFIGVVGSASLGVYSWFVTTRFEEYFGSTTTASESKASLAQGKGALGSQTRVGRWWPFSWRGASSLSTDQGQAIQKPGETEQDPKASTACDQADNQSLVIAELQKALAKRSEELMEMKTHLNRTLSVENNICEEERCQLKTNISRSLWCSSPPPGREVWEDGSVKWQSRNGALDATTPSEAEIVHDLICLVACLVIVGMFFMYRWRRNQKELVKTTRDCENVKEMLVNVSTMLEDNSFTDARVKEALNQHLCTGGYYVKPSDVKAIATTLTNMHHCTLPNVWRLLEHELADDWDRLDWAYGTNQGRRLGIANLDKDGKMYKFIEERFKQHPPQNAYQKQQGTLTLKAVQAVRVRHLEQGLKGTFEASLAAREGKGPSELLNPQNRTDDAFWDGLQKLHGAFEQSSKKARAANFLFSWHGTAKARAHQVCATGLQPLRSTDGVYFGTGSYSSLYADYASVSRGKDSEELGEHAMILLVTYVGCAYVVTREFDYPHNAARNAKSKFYAPTAQEAIAPEYDAHFVPINEYYHRQACSAADATAFELVARDPQACCPVAIVHYSLGQAPA